MNRRGFFGMTAAAIGWLWGVKAEAPLQLNAEYHPTKIWAGATGQDSTGRSYKLVRCCKTRLDEPDQWIWIPDNAR